LTLFIIIEIPKLSAIPEPEPREEPVENEDDDTPPAKVTQTKRSLKTSGPKVVDPYTADQTSSLIPLLIAIVAVIPVIFCLCRL
jgi:hypothetical protein